MSVEIPNQPISFMSAMNKFFGRKEGQSLGEFNAEIKALDDNDRAYFKKHLEAVGFVIA